MRVLSLSNSEKLKRAILKETLRECRGYDEAAILFSGGCDSLAIATALLQNGITPHAYTFALQEYESPDLIHARRMAKEFGIKHTEVIIPYDITQIRNDISNIIARFGPRKTVVECTYPLRYLKMSERLVFTGLGADLNTGLTKNAAMKRKDPAVWDALRRENVRKKTTQMTSLKSLNIHLTDRGHITCHPFYSKAVSSILLNMTWEEIHRPFEKAVIYEAMGTSAYRRHHSNYQVNAHIRERMVEACHPLTPIKYYNMVDKACRIDKNHIDLP